jgi:hypothetical protein
MFKPIENKYFYRLMISRAFSVDFYLSISSLNNHILKALSIGFNKKKLF